MIRNNDHKKIECRRKFNRRKWPDIDFCSLLFKRVCLRLTIKAINILRPLTMSVSISFRNPVHESKRSIWWHRWRTRPNISSRTRRKCSMRMGVVIICGTEIAISMGDLAILRWKSPNTRQSRRLATKAIFRMIQARWN